MWKALQSDGMKIEVNGRIYEVDTYKEWGEDGDGIVSIYMNLVQGPTISCELSKPWKQVDVDLSIPDGDDYSEVDFVISGQVPDQDKADLRDWAITLCQYLARQEEIQMETEGGPNEGI